jgi:hypothetical protein
MIVGAAINLADARARLRVSMDTLARQARISKGVIVAAEKGLPIQRSSAYAILDGLNYFREQAGLAPFSFDDFDWNIVKRRLGD